MHEACANTLCVQGSQRDWGLERTGGGILTGGGWGQPGYAELGGP